MEGFKKNILFFLFLLIFVFLPAISSAETKFSPIETYFKSVKTNEIEKDILRKDLPQEIYEIPDRPHYFLGINQVLKPSYERFIELQKLYQMKKRFYDTNGPLWIDKSVEKLGLHKNENYLQLISEVEVVGKKVLVVFPLHLLSDPVKKEFIYMSPLGPKNLAEFSPLYRKYEVQWGIGKIPDKKWAEIKSVLGWAQFQAVKQHVFDAMRKAIESSAKKYFGLTEKVLKIQQDLLSDTEVGEKLDMPIPGLKDIQIRDILMVPSVEPRDFVPDILVFGPLKDIWGAANIKTIGGEKIVFYDVVASAYDFMRDDPLVLTHEFVHTNPYIQGVPAELYFNVEMWTALTTDLVDELNLLLGHSYLPVVGDTVHTFLGYNVKEARKRIWPDEFVSLKNFNRKEFEENLAIVGRINSSLNEFITEVFFPNFYADTYFWNAVNVKWCDSSAAWRIMMAFYFEPAVIFDPKNVDASGKAISPLIQTKQWLSEQEASGKIKKLAEETMKRVGALTKEGEEAKKGEFADLVGCPVDSGLFHKSPAEIRAIKNMIEQLVKENDPEFLRVMWNLQRRGLR